jgi:hypothetical protein
MSLKHAALAGTVLALCAAINTAPVAAQPVNCADLYNRVMAVYQTAPLSPEYSQMAAAYGATCLAGASAAPAYPPYYPQYYAPAYQPYYGYAGADYPYYYDGYGYGVPVAVGLGLGFGRGFHRGGGFHHGGGGRGGGHGGGGGRHR